MRDLAPVAKGYLVGIWLLGAGVIGATLVFAPPSLRHLPILALWLALFVFADTFEARFDITERQQVIFTVTEAVLLFLVIVGGAQSILITALGTLIADTVRRRAWFRMLFNAAMRSIVVAVLVGIVIPLATSPIALGSTAPGLIGFALLAWVSYLLNAGLLVTMITLATGQSWRAVYRDGYQSTWWAPFVTLTSGSIAAILWPIQPTLALLSITPLILGLRGIQFVADRNAAQRATLTTQIDHLQRYYTDRVLAETHTTNNHLSALQGTVRACLQTMRDAGVPELTTTMHARRLEPILAQLTEANHDAQALALLWRNQLTIQPTSTDLVDVLMRVVAQMNPDYTRRACRLTLAVTGPIPPVWCDAARIRQALMAALDHALTTMEPGGTTRVDVRATEHAVACTITDTGHGYTAEIVRAWQADWMTSALWLAPPSPLIVCARIMALHQAPFSVTSPGPGQGTTVALTIPSAADGAPTFPASTPAPEEARSSATPTILVVDDQVEVCAAIGIMLTRLGYTTVPAHTGAEALQVYSPQMHGVICDLALPDMAGAIVLRRLRERDPAARVLIISGYTPSHDAAAWHAAGAVGVLDKPFTEADLRVALDALAHHADGGEATRP
jgi:CheY-like chemotaxis protein